MSEIKELLAGMNTDEKKRFLLRLVNSLVNGLTDDERQDVLQTASAGQDKGQKLLSMAET